MRRAAPICLALLAAPALAQSPDEIAAAMIEVCGDLDAAMPRLALEGLTSGNGGAGATEDGALTFASGEALDGVAVVNAVRTALDGGAMASCTLTVFGDGAPDPEGMTEATEAVVAELLGEETTAYGGATGTGVARVWATPGFPPAATLNLVVDQRVAILTLSRQTAD
ncbi:hypothetical protein [Wenxinia marina]|nr:hypothetical protein [Wenxinia marina]